MKSTTRIALLTFVAVLALLAAACGNDKGEVASSGGPAAAGNDGADSEDESTFPVTVSVADVETTIEAEPSAIVSLSPTGTEMLFAIGAGDQVVAADDYSDYPAEAPTTDMSAYEPNVEAIISYEPDLVVLSGDRNDVSAALADVGVPVLVLPSALTFDDTYTQIEVLGAATGHVGDAAELVSSMQTEIDELVAQVPDRDAPLTYFHELDDTLFSVTSQTFIGEVYALAGLENVADAADPDGENGGYPQVSAEFLVDADPDLFFLADTKCCGQTAETVAARGGFDGLSAVQNGNVVELDDDIASRWGPRIVDFLRTIVEATAEVEVPANAG
ncbi:ABC transporter substrate-binding protein [Actinospongicola halichondriae]|uniref:ABC transporter substrate-binding protein n=1 Tax=Actinospongicola halichondriae TaxID=3236844 RepID=UPI003D3DA9FE